MKEIFKDMSSGDRWRAYVSIAAALAIMAALAVAWFSPNMGQIDWNPDLILEKIDELAPDPVTIDDGKMRVWPGDADGDQLPNIIEALLGSSNESADTDADGFSDFEEFLNDFDPTIAGGALTDEMLAERYRAMMLAYEQPYQDPLLMYYNALLAQAERNNDVNRVVTVYQRMLDHLPALRSRHADALFYATDHAKYEEALGFAESYIAEYPLDWYGYFQKGYILYQTGAADEEVKALYVKALENGGKNVWLYNNYATILDREGSYEDALTYFAQAIEADSKQRLPYENIINLLRYLGRDDEADTYQRQLNDLPVE